ncbi:MAG: thermonuclease family protein [Xanthobacteraceae bacterium]
MIDGDTIAVGSRHVRLQGIDAPETDQICLDAQGQRWTCGIAARDQLSAHIAGRGVSCAARGEDRYGRTLATCSASGDNLNGWMVREGWALAYVQYSREYIANEAAAREQRRGMWGGEQRPANVRIRQKRAIRPLGSGFVTDPTSVIASG